jgi:hypothetical protein
MKERMPESFAPLYGGGLNQVTDLNLVGGAAKGGRAETIKQLLLAWAFWVRL